MIGRRAFLAGVGVAPMLAAAPAWAVSDFTAVSDLARAVVDDGVTPGLQITVRKGADLVFSQGFGMANLETATPLTSRSILRVGSVTKQFTAATLLLLEQDGTLSLDGALDRWLPDFPRGGEISLLRMLNHTSGLGNYTDVEDPADFFQAARVDRSTAGMVEWMLARPPLMAFEPGTGWAYSNTAYVLLGAVIEAAAGKPYGEVMKERLFAPLGLDATAVDDPDEILPQRTSGYTRGFIDPAGPISNASWLSMTFPGAAGSIRSTTDDLCRWHQALFGGRVLGEAGLGKMLTPATLVDGSAALSDGQPANYGLGIGAARPIASHTGGINGFVSYLGTHRDADVTVATMVNTDGGPDLSERVRAVRRAAWSAAGAEV